MFRSPLPGRVESTDSQVLQYYNATFPLKIFIHSIHAGSFRCAAELYVTTGFSDCRRA